MKDQSLKDFALGLSYLLGNGVDKDQSEAVKFFLKAANQNLAEAQITMGNCCYYGTGTERNYAEAYAWFNLAANNPSATEDERAMAARARDTTQNRKILPHSSKLKLLFVCSQNWRRSLTAERILADCAGYKVASAGTEDTARKVVSKELIEWADMIFAMELEHEQTIRQRFGQFLEGKKVITLSIPDIYRAMEPALIEKLKERLGQHIQM
ncbi:MAG: hypothetical protein EXS30_10180 [Pedosphaera sp.]|nr:hypothetical protein [Pedosphaera sp.]